MKMITRLLFVAFFALALSGFAYAAGQAPGAGQSATPPAGPSLQMSETSFDFGEVYEGKEYVHEFKVKNVGTATLEIKKVLPG